MNSITRAFGIMALACCLILALCLVGCNGGNNNQEDDSEDVFSITYNGTKIKLGDKADKVLSALGDAKDVKELGDCGGLGAQVKYSYNDLDVYTLKSGDSETVDQVTFRSDLVETSKGVCIGDSAEKAIEAHGEPSAKSDKELKYTSGNLVLKFKLDNGNITAIDLIRITK